MESKRRSSTNSLTREELIAEVVKLRDELQTARLERRTAWAIAAIFGLLFTVSVISGQEIERIPSPSDALGYLAEDLAKIPAEHREWMFYNWNPVYLPENAWHAASVTMNSAASRSRVIFIPQSVAAGNLSRWNLLALGVTIKEAKRIRSILHQISQLDRRFYTEIDVFVPAAPQGLDIVVDGERVDPISFAKIIGTSGGDRAPLQLGNRTIGFLRVGVKVPVIKQEQRGNEIFYFTEFERKETGETVKGWLWGDHVEVSTETPIGPIVKPTPADIVVRKVALGPHLENEKIAGLASILGETDPTELVAPMVSTDVFIHYALSQIDGGRYYDLMGFTGLDRDEIFERFGIDPGRSAELNADRRVGIYRSGVTGKPRQIERLQGIAGESYETLDIKDGDVDVDDHPIYNLLNFNIAARENIFGLPNGLLAYFLADGPGELVDEAPPDVATDRTIPSPFTARLQPAISCISCHGPFEGWQPAPNDVQRILAGRLRIFDDLGNLKAAPDEQVIRIANLFEGDFDRFLRRGRTEYNSAVWRAIGRQGDPGEEGRQAAIDTAALITQIYRDWKYTDVTPERALAELGYRIPEGVDIDPAAYLDSMIPNEDTVPIGFSPEDLTIGMLRGGLSVSRIDFERAYGTLAYRIQGKQLQQNRKVKTDEVRSD